MIAAVLAVVALMAGFWLLVLAPKRSEINAAKDKITQAESRRDAAVAAAAQAEQARTGYQSDYATVARLGKAVPADDDVASLVYQLETIARANKIDFRAVKLTGAGVAAAPAAATTAAATTKADGEKKDDESDSTAASTAPVAPVVAQPPPGAVVGTAGLLTVPFTFTFDGDYLKLQRLLKAINGLARNNKKQIKVHGRLLTVDGFSLAAGPEGFPKLKALVSATAYLTPAAGDASTATTPQNPAGATAGAATNPALTTNAQGAGR